MYRSTDSSMVLALIITITCLQSCESGDKRGNSDNDSEPMSFNSDLVGHYAIGRTPTQDEIVGWDIDIRPDGTGLPPGSGTVMEGEILFEQKCAVCHGVFGEGTGRWPPLAGGTTDELAGANPEKTVGSFWQYTSTLWDYVHRTMPFYEPQTLSDNEVYALTAFILYLNDIVDYEYNLTQKNLHTVRLPNERGFYKDPRPDSDNIACMKDCKDPASIQVTRNASELDVTPATHSDTGLIKSDDETEQRMIGSNSGQVNVTTQDIDITLGKRAYESNCIICHEAGTAGAPKLSDTEIWEKRIDKGLETLFQNAIVGFTGEVGFMPAKGGSSQLTDREVRSAVAYILQTAGVTH